MHRYLKVAATLLLLASTAFAGESKLDPAREPRERDLERSVGDVVIRTEGDRIVVMVDTLTEDGDAPDGVVDQWFTLQGDQAFTTPVMTYIPGAYVVHSPGTLRVTSRDRQGGRFHFVVPEGNLIGEGIAGIGLSHNIGLTSVVIADQLDRRGRVMANCEECGPLNADPTPGGEGGASNPCSSGGPGSTSCSVSSGSNSCSVACASGYYACCFTLTGGMTLCRCAR